MPFVWTEDETERLIMFYGQYQCLWNPFHPEFSNKLSRYKAYKKIQNSVDIPGLTVCDYIERIVSVKKEYCYELSKITAAIFCEKSYTPSVIWFEKLHTFLFPYVWKPHDTDDYKKSDNNNMKFNDNNGQDNFLHPSFDKSTDKQTCSNETCGTCQPQEIEFHLRLRKSIYPVMKQQNTSMSSETIQTVNARTETGNNLTTDHETQTDEQRHKHPNEGNAIDKRDRSTSMEFFAEEHCKRKIEDDFDIFGKSIAFQLRNIGIQAAMQLEKEIQGLIMKNRLKTLKSKLMAASSTKCCYDCNERTVIRNEETCVCGLTLKECLLLAKIHQKGIL